MIMGKVIFLPDGRQCEMINDDRDDDEILAEMEAQDEDADLYKNAMDAEPRTLTQEERDAIIAQKVYEMYEHINKLQSALQVAHNMVTCLLIVKGGEPVTISKEVIEAVTSAPRYTFDVLKQEDGAVVLDPRELSDEEIETIKAQFSNGNQEEGN